MKKAISLLLLFIFLSSGNLFGQLLRLPVLIHHYLEHHQQESASVSDFIYQHYFDTHKHNDTSNHEHNQLPFKANDMSHAQTGFCSIYFCVDTEVIYPSAASTLYHRHVNYFGNNHPAGVWQPPRTA